MASPKSTLLHHPRRAAIDAALAEGQSIRAVAARFGVSRDALQRYRKSDATGCKRQLPLGGTQAPAITQTSLPPVSRRATSNFSPSPDDPFDILSARYPWRDGETPQPDPLAERLRMVQRRSGTRSVRSEVLAMIGQYVAAGMTDETLGRKLDLEPWRIASWRAEREREAVAKLIRDPRSTAALELAAIEQRARLPNQRLLDPTISAKEAASCNAVLNQCARQRLAVLKGAGLLCAVNPTPSQDREPTIGQLRAGLSDVLIGAGVPEDRTLIEGVEEFGETLKAAWAAIDREDPDETEDE